MKKILILLLLPLQILAQEVPNSTVFWNTLKEHCGKTYEGEIVAGGKEGDGFTGKKLVMHVRSCEENTIRIPFFVGDDKSRTWVFTINEDDLIQLKHDHRHKDGAEDKVTQYGGINSNTGLANIQFFPADQHTANLIPYASNNIWWVTLNETSFTYNLRRIGSERLFSVKFDLTKKIKTPSAPWGSED
ncbi:hypothetical protein CW731_01000 [Polaribacter sp. ALD11]|uniref:hypothetical protein n=1 Tax=Polaribacter sp. ALD11 TaxID=2058137 RepID=UPI000C31305B|nr:hypothetical protein [Polaribacter sp. ALD11]AUC83952.1 hypothetical protein CW731_01000 [Polaribacter sp. ALD11]